MFTPFTQRKSCFSRLQKCMPLGCTRGTVKHRLRLRPKRTLLHSLRAALQQDAELEVIESNDGDVSTAAEINYFYAIAYKRLGIWVTFDNIQGRQNPLRDVDPLHAAELEASFCHWP